MKKRLATTYYIAVLLVCGVTALCILAAFMIAQEPRDELSGIFASRTPHLAVSQPKRIPQWFPKTPVDEATWRQLRDPTKSPSIRTRQLASGALRVSTTEFRGVLASARRDELDIRAGYRPPQNRSLLCGEVICAPVFASAQ